MGKDEAPKGDEKQWKEPSDGEAARAYIQGLLEVTESDAKNVQLLAAAAVALILLLVKDSIQLIYLAGETAKWFAGLTAIALAASAAFLFAYAAAINMTRMNIVKQLMDSNAARARELWTGKDANNLHTPDGGVQNKYGWVQRLGMGLFAIGALFAAITVALLLLIDPGVAQP